MDKQVSLGVTRCPTALAFAVGRQPLFVIVTAKNFFQIVSKNIANRCTVT